MKICNRCGHMMEDDDIEIVREFIGYAGDERQYQSFEQGCECGGEFVDAVKCIKCGEYFSEDDAPNFDYPICRCCLYDLATVENAIKYSQYSNVYSQVHINDFFTMIFTETEIFEILKAEVMKNPTVFERAAKDYCLDDIVAFSEYIKEADKE